MLCKAGLTVLLETSGALDISQAPPGVRVIMDVKCPSSGMSERMRWENLAALKPGDEVKFVLADRRDYEYARRVIGERLAHATASLLVSTVTGRLEPRQAVEWILRDRLPVRFQLQMHKYIWPPETRGV
jgi:7-carboxy-7-deazaguanine synthase